MTVPGELDIGRARLPEPDLRPACLTTIDNRTVSPATGRSAANPESVSIAQPWVRAVIATPAQIEGFSELSVLGG